jgi:hypothetical protein
VLTNWPYLLFMIGRGSYEPEPELMPHAGTQNLLCPPAITIALFIEIKAGLIRFGGRHFMSAAFA